VASVSCHCCSLSLAPVNRDWFYLSVSEISLQFCFVLSITSIKSAVINCSVSTGDPFYLFAGTDGGCLIVFAAWM